MTLIPFEEMPEDNAQLAELEVDFPRLPEDSLESCPVSLRPVLEYLALEVPHGESLAEGDLQFLRTAQVGSERYWIWRFEEPDDGSEAFVTVSQGTKVLTIGYESNFYGLTPEQFMLGDFHNVF